MDPKYNPRQSPPPVGYPQPSPSPNPASSFSQPLSQNAAAPNPLASPAAQQPTAAALNLRALIESKQHELSVISDYHSRALSSDNESLTAALQQSHTRYNQLKADFEYNLTLLAARDAELSRYDELSVSYARTLESKQVEFQEQLRIVESKLDAKSMELADVTDKYNQLRASTAALQEKLSSQSWNYEAELRAIRHNAEKVVKEYESKLQSKEESTGKLSYELLHNFEIAAEKAADEARDQQEKLQMQIKQLQAAAEVSSKELNRSQERVSVEQHRRTMAESRLEETNHKLIESEASVQELKSMLAEKERTHAQEVSELNASHESLVKKCVADYKSLVTNLDLVQNQAVQQGESHADEIERRKRDYEKQTMEIQSNYSKQLQALNQDLQLTQQQLRDSQTLAATSQQELNSYITAEQARTATLNDQLSTFQSQHSKQIQELNLSLWKSEEERKSLNEKMDTLKKSIEDRRAEISAAKEALVVADRKNEELERKLTEQRLKVDREAALQEEQVSQLRTAVKAAEEAKKHAINQRDAQTNQYNHAQALIVEYQQQLKSVREELLQMHSSENVALEKKILNEYPAIQAQLHEMGMELSGMGANMHGFDPLNTNVSAIGAVPSMHAVSSSQSSPRIGTYSMPSSMPPSMPASARSVYQPSARASGTFQQVFDFAQHQQHSLPQQQHQQVLRPRSQPPSLPTSARQEMEGEDEDEESSTYPPTQERTSHHAHNLSRISEMSDSGSYMEQKTDLERKEHHRRMSSSDPLPTASDLNKLAKDKEALVSSVPVPSLSSPQVKIVTAFPLNMQSDNHQPVEVETPAPSRRSSQMRNARKQSITSPNINLNPAQASLENMPASAMLPPAPLVQRRPFQPSISEHGEVHSLKNDSDSNSDDDFVEQPLSDSSLDNSRRPMKRASQMVVHSLPIAESVDEMMAAEMVNVGGSNSASMNNSASIPIGAVMTSGNRTPPEQAQMVEMRPTTGNSSARPIHSPRPYTPAFSEDMGPVSLPNSLPNSPFGVRPSSGPQSSGGGVTHQQQQQQRIYDGQNHLSPPQGSRMLSSGGASAARQQHISQIPSLPIPSHGYESAGGDQFYSNRDGGQESNRSSHSTTSHTSSHVALERSYKDLQRENVNLQQQNVSLSTIIREMKKELEGLMIEQQKQESQQMKLEQQAAKDLPPGTVPGTVSVPATQYKALQGQLQMQAQTLQTQTRQLEEQRSVYQKLQFHHALLLAELESVQNHLPPQIIQQHISAELNFLRTYTRELNATITNLKTELMYLQAQSVHSSQVLDNKNQQTILLHSQTQQLEQQQVALQFKDHKLLELDAQLQARTRELQECRQQLNEAQGRLASITLQAQQDATALKAQYESFRQQQYQQAVQQQQQQAAQLAAQQQQHQQAGAANSGQPSVHGSQADAGSHPPSVHGSQQGSQHGSQPASGHGSASATPSLHPTGAPTSVIVPPVPTAPLAPGAVATGFQPSAAFPGMVMPFPPHLAQHASQPFFSGPPYPSMPFAAPAYQAVYPQHAAVPVPAPSHDVYHSSSSAPAPVVSSTRRGSAPHVHSPMHSSIADSNNTSVSDLSSPPHNIRFRSRSVSTSPARSDSEASYSRGDRNRKRSGSSSARVAPHAVDSESSISSVVDLSLEGNSIHSQSHRRDVPFHASDRATESQNASRNSIRIRAEIVKKRDEAIKARADAARARVREQMKRLKQVERDRAREVEQDLQEMDEREKQRPARHASSSREETKQQPAAEVDEEQENNPWRVTMNEAKRQSAAAAALEAKYNSRSSSRASRDERR